MLCLGGGLRQKECVFEASGLLFLQTAFLIHVLSSDPLSLIPGSPCPIVVGCGLLEAHRAFSSYAVFLPPTQEHCWASLSLFPVLVPFFHPPIHP